MGQGPVIRDVRGTWELGRAPSLCGRGTVAWVHGTGDYRWILPTWFKSHKSRLQPHQRPRAHHFQVHMADVLRLPGVRVVVWASGPDLDSLHAWACATPGEQLHYAYVPLELQRSGVGRKVIEAAFGAWPDTIPTSYRMPKRHPDDRRLTDRFVFEPLRRAA